MTGPQQGLQISQLPPKFITKEASGFRSIPADGGWGMLNGSGMIQLNFFTDHHPLPDSITFPINPDGSPTGQMIEEYKMVEQKSIVLIREYQVGIVLSLDAAKHAHTVLGNFIAMAEDQRRLMMQQATAKTQKT